MADEVDITSEAIEKELTASINRHRQVKIPTNDTGVCWTCGEPVPDTRRWCCADCRDADPRGR